MYYCTFQVLDNPADLRLDLLFPDGVDEIMLYFSSKTGNVELGLELDFWSGTYRDPLVVRWCNNQDMFRQRMKKYFLIFFRRNEVCTFNACIIVMLISKKHVSHTVFGL